MKKYFAVFALIISALSAFAQNSISYTSFIQQDTAIKWAAECNKIANLTPKVSDYSIKQFYLKKLKSGQAICYKVNEDKRSVSPVVISNLNLERPDWLAGLECKFIPYQNVWAFISNNDPAKGYRVEGISKDPCCGYDEAEAVRVKQLLYYKNRRIYIQNVFLSPLCARKDTGNMAAWYPICNVAFNEQTDNNKPILLSKDIVLMNSEKIIYNLKKDNRTAEDSILTVGSESIFYLLFEDIVHGRIKANDAITGKLIPGNKFSSWGTPRFLVQQYDESGNIKGTREVSSDRNPETLSQIRIQQDWYFDFKNEKLFSRVKWIELMEDITTSQGVFLGKTAFCRIYY